MNTTLAIGDFVELIHGASPIMCVQGLDAEWCDLFYVDASRNVRTVRMRRRFVKKADESSLNLFNQERA